MDAIEEKIKNVHYLSKDLVLTGIMGEPFKTAELLRERARLLDELGESYEAQADRLAARFIRNHPDKSHFQLCCKRAAEIDLEAIAAQNGVRDFRLT